MKINLENITAQDLKDMGYVAMCSTFSYKGQHTERCNEEQSDILFAWTADTIQRGNRVDVLQNYWHGTVSLLPGAGRMKRDDEGPRVVTYFLQRDMSQAERLEGLLTGEDA